MPNVYVARHGETTWNASGRYQGRQESQLSELGVSQARALAEALRGAPIRRVISSPLMRCVASAAPCAREFGASIELDERLIEIAHGTWEGRYRDELAASDPVRYRAWREDPRAVSFEGGESVMDVLARWRAFQKAFSTDADTLVMTHDVVVRLAILDTSGEDMTEFWHRQVANCGYAAFEARGADWTLVDECVTAHLAGLDADLSKQAL